jgi:short-subunit dehydrogenase
MKSYTCLITGATSGLGKAILFELSKKNIKFILTSSDQKKITLLKKKLNKKNIFFKFFKVNLAERKELEKFTHKIRNLFNIDILINNAGFYCSKKEFNAENINKILFVNYFTPFYLTYKLISKIKKSKLKTIINIGSHAHINSSFNMKDFLCKKKNNWKIYKISKFFLTLFTNYLINIKNNKKMKIFIYDPGRLNTNFGSQNITILRLLIKFYLKIFGTNPDIVAKDIIKLIFNKNAKLNKNYNSYLNINKVDPNILDKDLQKKVWENSKKIFNL